jgi:hypothetical protein
LEWCWQLWWTTIYRQDSEVNNNTMEDKIVEIGVQEEGKEI